jgi:hypothetical protein
MYSIFSVSDILLAGIQNANNVQILPYEDGAMAAAHKLQSGKIHQQVRV